VNCCDNFKLLTLCTVIYSLCYLCDPAATKTSRTDSPKLLHRPKPDVNTLGNKSWRSAGGPGRDHSTLMELQLNKVTCQSVHELLCLQIISVIYTSIYVRFCSRFFFMWAWVSWFPLVFFLHFSGREPLALSGHLFFVLPNQQCQCTKHWVQPVAWPNLSYSFCCFPVL